MRVLLAIILFVAVVVIGIDSYLSPDDLRGCDAPAATGECAKADAIVAISGGDTEARTREAIMLYQKGWGDALVLSGAAQDKSGPSNAAAMRQIALNAGVPDSVIFIEEYSETTKQNAERTQDIFRQNDIDSVILVTSPYHQRRAGLEFNKRAYGEVLIKNHPVRDDKQWSMGWWLTPQGWYLAGGEITKILVFYLGGTR